MTRLGGSRQLITRKEFGYLNLVIAILKVFKYNFISFFYCMTDNKMHIDKNQIITIRKQRIPIELNKHILLSIAGFQWSVSYCRARLYMTVLNLWGVHNSVVRYSTLVITAASQRYVNAFLTCVFLQFIQIMIKGSFPLLGQYSSWLIVTWQSMRKTSVFLFANTVAKMVWRL